ncbi:MAG: SpoIID/LytB domain-containing protein, partial [Oscillospiraceae bacterium]|nr:SpoIID/LytB domain-containing protein [Oscillospiraceae bacterium]
YSIANSNQRAIGGWHIEFTSEYQLENLELDIFPAFINGAIVYRTGQFGSEQEALTALESIEQHEQMYITGPSPTALSLVNPITNKILFEFDDPNVTFALTAVQSGDSEAYLITPAKNKYSGVFEFKRSGNGVALTNLLPLDDYVSGVLPWEIGVSWPIGVQKAFAVTVRTFTVSMLGRHNSAYGFDLCNDTHCQMYAGIGRSTALTYQAVSETAGMILTYNGIPARTFYSAVAGGVTVSSNEAWGGASSPYLKAIPTPWEDYSRHSNGSWTAEVSPTQLLNTLISKGYTQLKGSIADIKINKFAENSTYVYSITFTDTYGTKVTLERCDNIRSTLSAHLKSANFVVAKAGQPVTITQYSYVKDVSSNSNMYAMTSNGLVNINSESTINIMNNIGAEPIPIDTAVTVLTSDGIKTYNIDINEKPSVIETSDTLSLPVVKSESTVIAQGKSGNFVFIGKGWGHGVGMSQFGAMNLAELGYDYKTILNTYFPGTLLQDYLK